MADAPAAIPSLGLDSTATRTAGSLGDALDLLQSLQPGTLLSGKIVGMQASGSLVLATAQGPVLALQNPSGFAIPVGSAVTLRMTTLVPQLQASIVTVNGAAPTSAGSLPIALNPAGAGGLSALLPLGVSVEDHALLTGGGAASALLAGQTSELDTTDALVQQVLATLVRAAPARLGSTPVPLGTRYSGQLSFLSDDTAEADSTLDAAEAAAEDAAPEPTPATLEGDQDSAPAASSLPASPAMLASSMAPASSVAALAAAAVSAASRDETTEEADADGGNDGGDGSGDGSDGGGGLDFQPQSIVLTGMLLPSRRSGETLVKTAIGTLSLPFASARPAGSMVQLSVDAVAPPAGGSARALAGDRSLPLLEDVARTLAATAPALAQQMQMQLALPPGGQLAAMLFSFLAGMRGGSQSTRWPDPDLRRALERNGRGDLAARLDAEAGAIGQMQPASARTGNWSVATLPFLGLAGMKPMRLYRRVPAAGDDPAAEAKGEAGRFVIEVELERLGPLQFDGRVEDRRFDLHLRSRTPLEDGLRGLIDRVFRDAITIGGWRGELVYAPLNRYPLAGVTAGVGEPSRPAAP